MSWEADRAEEYADRAVGGINPRPMPMAESEVIGLALVSIANSLICINRHLHLLAQAFEDSAPFNVRVTTD